MSPCLFDGMQRTGFLQRATCVSASQRAGRAEAKGQLPAWTQSRRGAGAPPTLPGLLALETQGRRGRKAAHPLCGAPGLRLDAVKGVGSRISGDWAVSAEHGPGGQDAPPSSSPSPPTLTLPPVSGARGLGELTAHTTRPRGHRGLSTVAGG